MFISSVQHRQRQEPEPERIVLNKIPNIIFNKSEMIKYKNIISFIPISVDFLLEAGYLKKNREYLLDTAAELSLCTQQILLPQDLKVLMIYILNKLLELSEENHLPMKLSLLLIDIKRISVYNYDYFLEENHHIIKILQLHKNTIFRIILTYFIEDIRLLSIKNLRYYNI